MAKLVGTAELVITPKKSVLVVDGQEFPFHILADDIEVVTTPDGTSFFRVSVLAQSVQVRADLGAEPIVPVESGPWDGVSEGDEVQAFLHMPEPPYRITVLEEIGCVTANKFLVRAGSGWLWSTEPRVEKTEGDPWKKWFKYSVKFTESKYKVVAVDD
jgi:hypothetical protein